MPQLNRDADLAGLKVTHLAELKLYANGRLKLRGEMAGVLEAVVAAERAYKKSLPKKPPVKMSGEEVTVKTFKDRLYHPPRK